MTIKQLEQIAYGLREMALSRWTQDDIMMHVSVTLPAPVYDHLAMDLRRELDAMSAQIAFDVAGRSDTFRFAGVRFTRLAGRYWSADADMAADKVRPSA